jgi:hypothetical protein
VHRPTESRPALSHVRVASLAIVTIKLTEAHVRLPLHHLRGTWVTNSEPGSRIHLTTAVGHGATIRYDEPYVSGVGGPSNNSGPPHQRGITLGSLPSR